MERNSLIRRFEIPQRIVERGSGLASITVDVQQSNCNNAYGYIPDLAAYRFYVYRLVLKKDFKLVKKMIFQK